MVVGEKIRRIRIFRGMTQKELGIAIGLGEKGADNRITQYENGYRVPKPELLYKIAHVLRVNPQNLHLSCDDVDNLVFDLLWFEEQYPDYIRLFLLERKPNNRTNDSDNCAQYEDGKNWPIYPPVGLYFNHPILAQFLREWMIRHQQLEYGEITREEYTEWKLNWPYTCDSRGVFDGGYIDWKKK
nr:helix-turn-helix transcriptional regulator [uncultured Butyricicoccus sp.]